MIKREIDRLMRRLIAAQVALLELEDEDISEDKAIQALQTCIDEINARFKALKKALP